MSKDEYKLSTVLYGHSLDVRAVDVDKDNNILSGSRDKTAKFWKPNGFNSGYTDSITFQGHKNYVSSVCFLPSSSGNLNGLIITGGNDSCICVYIPGDLEPAINAKVHSNTVCNLSRGNNPNTFLSSSWDCTSKLWLISSMTLKELVTLTGHQAAVWAAIQLPNNNIVTGSADKDIVIWSEDGRKLKILKGHTDCVRGLTVLNDGVFLSVANDASIKQWTFEGECIETLYGHSNYIYSVCVNGSNEECSFVTAGEDRTIRYWVNGENSQTITLPAQSVWSVACLTNGDIVTGSSDGLVRVFTQDPDRIADEATLKAFEEEVASLNVASSQEIGGVKISDLPGREVLYEPGKTDGQTKLVREGASVMCYSWSMADGTWNKVGDVMGAAGGTQATSGKSLHEGKEYDFVFSVDIEDGKPPLKLPYNLDQDPWFSAQEFIHKNELPQAYLDQVAGFIVQNSGGAGRQPQASTASQEFVDPFTGGSRYMPGGGAVRASDSGVNLDPFTGGSSYSTSTAQPRPVNHAPADAAPDPFTGAHAYTTTTNRTAREEEPAVVLPSSGHAYFPHLHYLRFEQGNTAVILEKMIELNRKTGDSGCCVDEGLLEGVVKLADNSQGDELFVDVLMQLLNWPHDVVFPVLDITRLAIRHAENNLLLCSAPNGATLLSHLRRYLRQESTANRMLSLRTLCNMFAHSPGETLVVASRAELVTDLSEQSVGLMNKNCQIALATFLLNLGIALVRIKDNVGITLLCTIILKTVFVLTDPEAEFRCFVALGTVLSQVELATRKSIINNLETFGKLREKLGTYDIENFNDPNYARNLNCAKQLNHLIA